MDVVLYAVAVTSAFTVNAPVSVCRRLRAGSRSSLWCAYRVNVLFRSRAQGGRGIGTKDEETRHEDRG
jgi:hypothetical protein